MRNPGNRQEVRRLYVLGAGASFAATTGSRVSRFEAPLDADFCKRILELNVQRPLWVQEARDRVRDQWKDNTPLETLGLEDAILRQLGHLEFISAVHPRRKRKAITEFEWLSLLTHLICYVMRHTKESSRDTYRKFADKVYPANIGTRDYEDRVITFNYDDLLDRYVTQRVGIKNTYFDKIKRSRSGSPYRSLTFDAPLIVKLHGCINWRCEKMEFEGIVKGEFADTPHWIPVIWHVARSIPSPDDEVYPLIVPPLPSKPLSSIKLFQYLWTRAYEYLHEARELVICGYSLPPADRLASSLFGNFLNQRLEQVTIVDPNPAIISKWRQLLRRKGVADARWVYHEDFAAYVEQL